MVYIIFAAHVGYGGVKERTNWGRDAGDGVSGTRWQRYGGRQCELHAGVSNPAADCSQHTRGTPRRSQCLQAAAAASGHHLLASSSWPCWCPCFKPCRDSQWTGLLGQRGFEPSASGNYSLDLLFLLLLLDTDVSGDSGDVTVKVNVDLYLAPCRDHTSKALKYDLTVLPALPAYIR